MCVHGCLVSVFAVALWSACLVGCTGSIEATDAGDDAGVFIDASDGADDPGDVIVSSIGCKLTVVRPDYLILSQTVRQILDGKITAPNGSSINSPMKWIYRDSTQK